MTMETKLIIARHGNTFGPKDTPTRVGARTDLSLVEKGHQQAQALGAHLKEQNLLPDQTYTSNLKRTIETAQSALKEASRSALVSPLEMFNEIDYGPDENQTEDVVIERIGKNALEDWDKNATVPEGWKLTPSDVIESWKHFAKNLLDKHAGQTSLVVTSNGIARFAPHITGDFEGFRKKHNIKLSTGAYGVLIHNAATNQWRVESWNIRP